IETWVFPLTGSGSTSPVSARAVRSSDLAVFAVRSGLARASRPLSANPRARESLRTRPRKEPLISPGLRSPLAGQSFRLPRRSPPSTRSAHLPLRLRLCPPPSVLRLPRRPLLPLLASPSPFACHAGHRLQSTSFFLETPSPSRVLALFPASSAEKQQTSCRIRSGRQASMTAMPDCRWRRRWVPQLQTRSYGSTVVTVKSERASADQQVVQPAGFSSPEQLLRQAVRRCAPDVHQVLQLTVLMPACQPRGALLRTKR
ncbi:unnamed protein product, partial [Urochloa humidicola]